MTLQEYTKKTISNFCPGFPEKNVMKRNTRDTIRKYEENKGKTKDIFPSHIEGKFEGESTKHFMHLLNSANAINFFISLGILGFCPPGGC